MKNTINLISVSIVFCLLNGCTNKSSEKINHGPDIYVTSPVNNDTLQKSSNLFLSMVIADVDDVHDVDISIFKDTTLESDFNMFFDHIHDAVFELDTNIDISNFNISDTFYIKILANDMQGNLNSNTLTLQRID